ncbi:hypothetical protein cypCar_00020375 [Cyprinus carpio]|nr:hypothetical protein cypCar_00020375 [Cyprinus carpio]
MTLRAKALYTFQSENKEEISIQENEELVIFDENSVDGWLQGENSRGERGLFPASYVHIIRNRSGSNLTDHSLSSPGSSPGKDISYIHTPSTTLPSDDDDDWDDWDETSTVVEDEDPRRGVGANGHSQSPYSNPNVHYRPKPYMERQDSMSSNRKGSMVGRNLNRFSSFVRSGVEAFILGDVPMMAKNPPSLTLSKCAPGLSGKDSLSPSPVSLNDRLQNRRKFKGN